MVKIISFIVAFSLPLSTISVIFSLMSFSTDILVLLLLFSSSLLFLSSSIDFRTCSFASLIKLSFRVFELIVVSLFSISKIPSLIKLKE